MTSHRRVLFGVAMVAAASCQPVAVCRTEADCAPDGVCAQGLCVQRAAAGDGGLPGDAGPSLDAGPVDAGAPVDDAGAPDAGEPDAGLVEDAGVMDAGLPFDAGSCLSCPEGFACDEALRACTLQVQALVFVRPDANDVYGGGRPVRLEVRAELDASVPLPATLQVVATPPDFTPPPLVLQPGVAAWAADATTPADGGAWLLTARAVFTDAGFSATTQLTVDARRPSVSLSIEPAPARVNDGGFSDRDPVVAFSTAHKKDELVELRVEATSPVSVLPADFGLPAQSVTPQACSSACPSTRSCFCFSLDLARVRLDALRGVLDAGVGPLPDALGNLSDPTSVAIAVTRWKWRRTLLESNQSGLDLLHPPALDAEGRVHVGVGYAGSTGSLWQILPGGETRVDVAIDRVYTPPIVTGRSLYAQGGNQQVRRYDTVQTGSTLSPVGNTFCNNERWEGLGAMFDERLFLLGNAGRLYAGTSMPSAGCDGWTTQPSTPDYFAPLGVVVAAPLAGTAARLFFGRPAERVASGMMRVDYFPMAATRYQNQRQATNPRGTTSLAVFDDVVASTSKVAPRTVALQVWNADLTTRADALIPGDAGTTFGPLVAMGPRSQPTFLFGDAVGTLRRFSYAPGTADGGVFGPDLAPIGGVDPLEGGALGVSAPVLGGNGLAYLVSPTTGRLSVVNTATAQVEWTQANAFTPGAVSPALDVVRDRMLVKQCARGVGLLYVAARNDAALTAVVVDSPGLDATSPWPRFHHDNGNTGNPDTPLSSWACP
ncbi:MAG: hypothetical protein IAE78_01775 [Myxococcus sp.]|nr:hypothetical protein [Myxococcus sp.]